MFKIPMGNNMIVCYKNFTPNITVHVIALVLFSCASKYNEIHLVSFKTTGLILPRN